MTSIVITPPAQQKINVTISGSTVIVQRPQTAIATIVTPGPQGPAFAGRQFFDTEAMESLSAADSGATVKWNGTQFVPTAELSDGLTLNGGAF